MKTITSILAAAAFFATASTANANFAEDFFKQQQLYGENIAADFFEKQALYGEHKPTSIRDEIWQGD